MVDPLTAQDIECGRHSGIPECCVQFFVGPYRKIINGDDGESPLFRVQKLTSPTPELLRYREMIKAIPAAEQPLYVQCWECLKNRRPPVKILKCTCAADGRIRAAIEAFKAQRQAQQNAFGFPARVVIDDVCDMCGPEGLGRFAVSWGFSKPVICDVCVETAGRILRERQAFWPGGKAVGT